MKFSKKLRHQRELYKSKGIAISDLVDESVFLSLCSGTGYMNWDDNYFCIIEQQLGEVSK